MNKSRKDRTLSGDYKESFIDPDSPDVSKETIETVTICYFDQGCQMVNFQVKNSNLGKLGRALEWQMLEPIL
jgi:hypothetical protein